MIFGLPTFMRTTTFRLALAYSAMFALFSATLLIWLYSSTVVYIRNEAGRRLDTEFRELERAYFNGGMERLSEAVFDRAGSYEFLYYLEGPSQQKLGGQLLRLPEAPEANVERIIYFDYELPAINGEMRVRSAAGRIVRIRDNGGALMVAFDTAQQTEILNRIQRAIFIAAPIGLGMSLLGGLLISRGAARRAEDLARTAEAVMGGELGRRASVREEGDEFDRLGARLNAMLDQIQKLVESSRHTGNAIAHDLRSPLSRLRNRLEVALAEPLTREQAHATLGETVEEVDRVLETFNAILRLSRLEAGAEAERTRLDVGTLATELADLYTPACEEAELSFKAQIAKNLIVLGDRNLIGQALSNLIDNAIKYTPAGGSLIFTAQRTADGYIDLIVSDTGPGIPADKRALVVQRFQRLDSARTQPGSGLGLSLADMVAQVHEGELILEHGTGPIDKPGLKATLRLPRA